MNWRQDYPPRSLTGQLIVVAMEDTDEVKMRGTLEHSNEARGAFDVTEQAGDRDTIPLLPHDRWMLASEYDKLDK